MHKLSKNKALIVIYTAEAIVVIGCIGLFLYFNYLRTNGPTVEMTEPIRDSRQLAPPKQ